MRKAHFRCNACGSNDHFRCPPVDQIYIWITFDQNMTKTTQVNSPKFMIFQILCEVNLLFWFMDLKGGDTVNHLFRALSITFKPLFAICSVLAILKPMQSLFQKPDETYHTVVTAWYNYNINFLFI